MTTSKGTAVRKSLQRKKASSPVAKKHREPPKYFLPSASKHPILNEAHKMVKELVFGDGPYRRKVLDLVTSSIEEFHKEANHQIPSLRSSTVVTSAWNHLMYTWCPGHDHRLESDESIASACMGTKKNHGGDNTYNFPVIAFRQAFKENDLGRGGYHSSKSSTGDRKTLLLFFRKIKREFLHLIQGYLEIRYKKRFSEASCPERYLPQNRPFGCEPKAGEHDEEEDSGGSILPFTPKEKLSQKNLLCLSYNGRYFPLSNKQVEALLDLELYSAQAGMEGQEHGGASSWTPEESRVRKSKPKIFTKDFLNDGVQTYYTWAGFTACGPRSIRGRQLLRNHNDGSCVMVEYTPGYSP